MARKKLLQRNGGMRESNACRYMVRGLGSLFESCDGPGPVEGRRVGGTGAQLVQQAVLGCRLLCSSLLLGLGVLFALCFVTALPRVEVVVVICSLYAAAEGHGGGMEVVVQEERRGQGAEMPVESICPSPCRSLSRRLPVWLRKRQPVPSRCFLRSGLGSLDVVAPCCR